MNIEFKVVKYCDGHYCYEVIMDAETVGKMMIDMDVVEAIHNPLSNNAVLNFSFPWATASDGTVPGRTILPLMRVCANKYYGQNKSNELLKTVCKFAHGANCPLADHEKNECRGFNKPLKIHGESFIRLKTCAHIYGTDVEILLKRSDADA